MTSFTLQEGILYNIEHSSKGYACYLDIATAFDTIWHEGLFVKMHELGIKGKLWRLLKQAYTERKIY